MPERFIVLYVWSGARSASKISMPISSGLCGEEAARQITSRSLHKVDHLQTLLSDCPDLCLPVAGSSPSLARSSPIVVFAQGYDRFPDASGDSPDASGDFPPRAPYPLDPSHA